MAPLIKEHGCDALMQGLTLRQFMKTRDMLKPLIEKCDIWGDIGATAAIAYHIGIKQGVHNERARRKGATI